MNCRLSEPEIKEPGPRELHAIEFILGLHAQILINEPVLEARLRLIPNGWRNYRLIRRLIDDIVDGLYATMPVKTVKRIIRLLDCGEIIIRPKPVIPVPNMQIVEANDIEMIINTVLRTECSLCVKDAKEARKCALRKAMMQITPAESLHRISVCPYRDVILDCDGNDYFSEE